MVFMNVFINYFFDGWSVWSWCGFLLKSCFYFFLQLLRYDEDIFWFLDENGGNFRMDDGDFIFFFSSFYKLLSPIRIFTRLPLPDVRMESCRRDSVVSSRLLLGDISFFGILLTVMIGVVVSFFLFMFFA